MQAATNISIQVHFEQHTFPFTAVADGCPDHEIGHEACSHLTKSIQMLDMLQAEAIRKVLLDSGEAFEGDSVGIIH